MALITQVQILQVMARMGGSKGQTGMAYLANSLGQSNILPYRCEVLHNSLLAFAWCSSTDLGTGAFLPLP